MNSEATAHSPSWIIATLRRWINTSFTLCGLGLLLATLLGFAGRWHWALDLLSHFRLQFLTGACAMLFIAGWARHVLCIALFAGAVLVNGACVAPYLPFAPTAPSSQERLKLMSINSFFHNQSLDQLAHSVRTVDPDIVFCCEMLARNKRESAEWIAEFPYQVLDNRHETMLLSKIPIVKSEFRSGHHASRSQPVAEFEWRGRRFTVAGMHTRTPTGRVSASIRNIELDSMASWIRTQDATPLLLVGDWNITPYSPVFQHFLQEAQLQDARVGKGIMTSWGLGIRRKKESFLQRLTQIPIDHCAYSAGVEIASFSTGPPTGSDHLPIVIEFWLTDPQ
ncbi:MAG: hypothetical protein R3C28_17025 [Pirellulaceae bacterium]